ncbi:MAG: ABC transporter permease [Rhodospirillales bacterium]|nr:ABC transporter permease [Rhodospirillales bacterium]
MAFRRIERGVLGAAGVAGLVLLWQAAASLSGVPRYFFPSPRDVAGAFTVLLEKGILPAYLADSAGRYLAGIGLGTAIGLALGLALGVSRRAASMFGPLLNFFYAIVEVAWIPIFVIWWGYGLRTILVALVYVVAFPVLFNTQAAVRATPRVLIDAVRALGASPRQVLGEVIFPAALPGIITGFRVGAGFAFRGLIFAEMIAAKNGIGYLILTSAANHATDRTIAGMIVVGTVWLVIDQLYLRPFERVTVERWGVLRHAEE